MRFTCLFLVGLLGTPLVGQEDNSPTRMTLVGLNGLYVLVEDIERELTSSGELSNSVIQTDVELKLRMAGIPVLTPSQGKLAPGRPCLYVNLNGVRSSGRPTFLVYDIKLWFVQTTTLARDPSISIWTPTWTTSTVGYVGENRVRAVREVLGDLVEEFINAYLAANPKR